LRIALDAESGSATFAAADSPTQYEVRVSTTGLLIRKLAPQSNRRQTRTAVLAKTVI